jgi:hypothetical protein
MYLVRAPLSPAKVGAPNPAMLEQTSLLKVGGGCTSSGIPNYTSMNKISLCALDRMQAEPRLCSG